MVGLAWACFCFGGGAFGARGGVGQFWWERDLRTSAQLEVKKLLQRNTLHVQQSLEALL